MKKKDQKHVFNNDPYKDFHDDLFLIYFNTLII